MAEAMLELEEPIPAEMNREAGNGLPEKVGIGWRE